MVIDEQRVDLRDIFHTNQVWFYMNEKYSVRWKEKK